MMKKLTIVIGSIVFLGMMVSTGYSAYHHEGEKDAVNFLSEYPDKAGTKLDHCASCHTGGTYEKKPGKWVSLGSCQWCHYSYGHDGSGNIMDTMNDYGKDYLVNGRNQAAIKTIEGLDSDGDTYSNITEINAVSYPGNPEDDPSKAPAPSIVFTKAQLEAMEQHTQFMLMNTSRSGDSYKEYSGVILADVLAYAGILNTATGITVFAPDGWSDYHPLEPDPTPELYSVNGIYPEAIYYYDTQADTALNSVDGWCDYNAPSCVGRSHLDPITVPGGLRTLLAIKRDGAYLDPGVLNADNKLDGEGPYRVVPPQKVPSPPDQSSNASNQDVTWPYNYDWDHNAGSATRSATIIRVEPLPPGTTDIDFLEVGWDYIDEEKIIIYGAISAGEPTIDIKANALDGPVTVSPGTNITITTSLIPGNSAGQNADWWIAAYTPSYPALGFFTFSPTLNWQPGLDNVAHQGPLDNLFPPFQVFNAGLPLGDYTFYFFMDDNVDGVPDITGVTCWDSVDVHVE